MLDLLQAFVELGSIDQAKDLVKFHVNYPPTVNGQQMEFRITNTFTFLQVDRSSNQQLPLKEHQGLLFSSSLSVCEVLRAERGLNPCR